MAYIGNPPVAPVAPITLPLNVVDGGTGSSTPDLAKSALQVWTTATGGLFVPAGTTAQRDTPTAIKIRYNNELNTFEGANGTTWSSLAGDDKADLFYESNASYSTFKYATVPSVRFKQGGAFPIEQTLTYGATINWNVFLGQVGVITLTGASAIMAAPTNLTAGMYYALEIRQDVAGGRTLVWNSIFHFAQNTAPTLSATGSLKDYFTFKSDGTNLYEQGRSQGVV